MLTNLAAKMSLCLSLLSGEAWLIGRYRNFISERTSLPKRRSAYNAVSIQAVFKAIEAECALPKLVATIAVTPILILPVDALSTVLVVAVVATEAIAAGVILG